jgi:hypothetical protein
MNPSVPVHASDYNVQTRPPAAMAVRGSTFALLENVKAALNKGPLPNPAPAPAEGSHTEDGAAGWPSADSVDVPPVVEAQVMEPSAADFDAPKIPFIPAHLDPAQFAEEVDQNRYGGIEYDENGDAIIAPSDTVAEQAEEPYDQPQYQQETGDEFQYRE